MKLLSPPKPSFYYHQPQQKQHYYCSFFFNNNNNSNHNKKLPVDSLSLFLPSKFKKPKKDQTFKWVPRMDSTTTTATPTTATVHHQQRHHHHHPNQRLKKDKLIVIMGATGTGKTKLSIELAQRFNGEIINSDKMQVYKGLDITTNKVPMDERGNIKHHLLGELDPEIGELTRSEFRQLTWSRVKEIALKKKVPILAGGSNSFVYAALTDRFKPELNVFEGLNSADSLSSELRYNCCFLWVDVSFNVLCDYLCKRVDDMLDEGMVEELVEFYESDSVSRQPALRKAIGVPEFYRCFKLKDGKSFDWVGRDVLYEDAVNEIKQNTCQLAKKQIGKIILLKKRGGWGLRRLDATASFRKVLRRRSAATDEERERERREWRQIWEKQVVEPSVKIVKKFLEE